MLVCLAITQWSRTSTKNLRGTETCDTILESPGHADCKNISGQFKHCRRRTKIRFLSGKNPDFRRIRIFGFETGLYRQAIEFCVEKW